ncbi:MAG: cell division protein FtsL [Firmicutes bacterium]|nr:cell division protein FtsL [Bacillota bacterium]
MLVERKQEWTELAEQEPQKQPQSNRRKRPQPNWQLRSKCLKLVAVAIMAAMVVTLHSEAMVRSGYSLVQMKKEAAKLEKENDLLRLEIAKLKSPERVAKIATSELGLVKPKNAYFADGYAPGAATLAQEPAKSMVAAKVKN